MQLLQELPSRALQERLLRVLRPRGSRSWGDRETVGLLAAALPAEPLVGLLAEFPVGRWVARSARLYLGQKGLGEEGLGAVPGAEFGRRASPRPQGRGTAPSTTGATRAAGASVPTLRRGLAAGRSVRKTCARREAIGGSRAGDQTPGPRGGLNGYGTVEKILRRGTALAQRGRRLKRARPKSRGNSCEARLARAPGARDRAGEHRAGEHRATEDRTAGRSVVGHWVAGVGAVGHTGRRSLEALSHVEGLGLVRPVHDEAEARGGVFAHEVAHDAVRLEPIGDLDSE